MLEKMSFLSKNKGSLVRRRFFWATIGSEQRIILNHCKVFRINPENCENRISNLRTSKLIKPKNVKQLQIPKTNLSELSLYYGRNFNELLKIYCVPRNRRMTTASDRNIKNYEYKVPCPLKLDSTFVFNRIKKYITWNQSSICSSNCRTEVKTCAKVNIKPHSWEQNLFQRKVSSLVLQENTVTSVNRRLFSTSTTSEGNKEANISLGASSTINERFNVAPKNILHNAYDVVAQELKNREFKLQPVYSIIKGKNKNISWLCTYNTKWPQLMKFVSTGQTKQEASHKAALSALLWLRKNEKITKEGHPLIIAKEDKEIVKQTQPSLTLDLYTIDQMKIIVDMYKTQFLPILTQSLDARGKHVLIPDEADNSDLNVGSANLKQKLFDSRKYLAQEKIHLPISKYKEQFISLLETNRVVIIKGEPGCGKSTRIPQYVLELWAREGLKQGEPCQIAVTQPRRIAAISLADRVSDERYERCGHIVGYQIRLKSNYNPVTGRILYCTTGILLKYLQSDTNLSNLTHIILDEAHERDVNTDLLMNLLKSALKTNPKLKLIVMSATVDVDLFRNYLNDPPVMHIPGFTYSVKSHFLDDLGKLDLRKSYNNCSDNEIPNVAHEDVVKVIDYIHRTKDEGAILCFLPGWEDIRKIEKLIPPSNDMTVLCLHSRLQDSDQRKIFSQTPPGIRKVILSTNIAETSITIDDVVYVIDTGIHKENRFDNDRGVACIDNYWISQSSMTQRKGRAGRVQPGESFHLYTKAKYESFSKFTDPEILKTSLTKIVLNSKVYSNNMDALEFMSQLPSPPEKNATRRAVRELKELQLLDDCENLTPLGRTLANFQLEPKLAKILVNSVVYKCVTPVVDIVTIFSADTELFSSGLVDKEGIKKIKAQGSKHSDHLAMMRLFEAWLELLEDCDEETARRYCSDANLVHHKMVTLNKLRKIHFDYLYNGLHQTLPIIDNYSDNDELVKALLFSGAGNLLRHRNWDIVKGRYKKGNVFLTNYNQKATIASESVNFKKTSLPSSFLVYFNEVRSNIRRTTVIRECSVISPIAVLLFSNKDLLLREAEDENDRMVLSLKDTKVEFSCSREEALHIQKCKEALDSIYHYFIFQMTEGGEGNSHVNQIWDKILERVNMILVKHSVK